MIQSKNNWNNSDQENIARFQRDPESATKMLSDTEYKLLPRLKFMGYIFFCLSLASLVFAFFVHGQKIQPLPVIIDENSILTDIERLSGAVLFTDMAPLEIAPEDVLNFYAVSFIFGSIGASLFYLSFKKRQKLTE